MRKISSIFISLITSLSIAQSTYGEEIQDSIPSEGTPINGEAPVVQSTDSLTVQLESASFDVVNDPAVTKKPRKKITIPQEAFKPDPRRATWYAIVCPGLGQIYNRSYWKLPILYGGVLTCTYLISWNGRMYNDYRNAYHDIIDSDPNTESYLSLFPTYDGTQSWLPNTLHTKMNNYRRTRDMSVFVVVLLYMVSAVDAFVDAHLYDFTVSEDLSLRVEPIINSYSLDNVNKEKAFGFQCSITF